MLIRDFNPLFPFKTIVSKPGLVFFITHQMTLGVYASEKVVEKLMKKIFFQYTMQNNRVYNRKRSERRETLSPLKFPKKTLKTLKNGRYVKL